MKKFLPVYKKGESGPAVFEITFAAKSRCQNFHRENLRSVPIHFIPRLSFCFLNRVCGPVSLVPQFQQGQYPHLQLSF